VHKAKAVADLAKEIVKQWKTAVEKAKLKGSSHTVVANRDSGAHTPPSFVGSINVEKQTVRPRRPLLHRLQRLPTSEAQSQMRSVAQRVIRQGTGVSR